MLNGSEVFNACVFIHSSDLAKLRKLYEAVVSPKSSYNDTYFVKDIESVLWLASVYVASGPSGMGAYIDFPSGKDVSAGLQAWWGIDFESPAPFPAVTLSVEDNENLRDLVHAEYWVDKYEEKYYELPYDNPEAETFWDTCVKPSYDKLKTVKETGAAAKRADLEKEVKDYLNHLNALVEKTKRGGLGG